MAKEVVLSAEARSATGKGWAKRLRAEGKLPAVIYGKGIEPTRLAVPRSDVIRTLHAHGAHPLVTVKIDSGEEHLALVKDVQVDAVHREALHVDFHRVQENKPVQTVTAINIVGDAAGVKLGGVMEVHAVSISISALPRAIPEAIDFDISEMNIGDVARVGDITAPDGVTILTDPDETLVTVTAPRVEEAAPAAAEGEEGAEAAEEGAEGEEAAASSEGGDEG